MNPHDHITITLLLLFGFVLSTGVALILLAAFLRRRSHWSGRPPALGAARFVSLAEFKAYPALLNRPPDWLAVKCRSVLSVQSALGLNDPQPCSWWDGLAETGEQRLFISPPVDGWIIVFGSELPAPDEDVDACFRFLLDLSRKLGHVQFFSANRALNHHAWVWVESGRVVRAYAWAGKTLWNQGRKTDAENELNVKCFDYAETPDRTTFGPQEGISANVDKVAHLAARWSLDPADIDERALEAKCGIAGKLSHSRFD